MKFIYPCFFRLVLMCYNKWVVQMNLKKNDTPNKTLK
jgi:hypothetical protein